MERRIAAQNAVTRALVEAGSIDEAFRRIVREVPEHLGWGAGVAWRPTADGALLEPVAYWVVRVDPAFEQALRAARPRQGEGLPGRVWATGEPAWAVDVARDSGLPGVEAANAAGLRSALAVPVPVGSDIGGVLEFFADESVAPDALLIDTLRALGEQVGLALRWSEAERRLHVEEARYRLVTETSPDVVIVTDEESIIRSVNPAVERVFGWRPEELIGVSLDVIMPPDERQKHHDGVRHYLETGERLVDWSHVESPGLARDGRIIQLEMSFGTFVTEGKRSFTGIIRDVTDRREQQHRLEETAAELEATVEELEAQRVAADQARREAEEAREAAINAARWSHFLAEAGRALATSVDREDALNLVAGLAVPAIADICLVDVLEADGTINRIAIAYPEDIERPRAEEYWRRFPASQHGRTGAPQVIRTGEPELYHDIGEADLRRFARSETHLEVLRRAGLTSGMVVPMVARGRTLGAITLVSTSSNRHYTSEDLSVVEALADRAALAVANVALYEQALAANHAKSNFLAIMSHELRTPLTAIMGYTDILQAGIAGMLELRQREYLERVMVSARHLLELIDEILAFARLEVGRERTRYVRVPLAEFTRETANLVRPAMAERQLRFDVRVPEEEAYAETDPEKLRQVLLDILLNAAKFTPRGGVTLDVHLAGEKVCFDVQDTGIGIDREDLPRIFEPFWQAEEAMTRKEGGTGIGLSVARRLVHLLGGEIVVTSDPGQGTIFSVRIPQRAPGSGAAAA